MATTATIAYSKYVTGEMRGRKSWLDSMSDAFQWEGGAQAGTGKARMQDRWTTGTPVAGTPLSDTSNNIHATINYATAYAGKTAAQHERESGENAEGLITGAEAGADALLEGIQNAIIAALKAATISAQYTLPTGSIDFAAAGTETTGGVAKVVQQLGKAVGYVRGVSGGSNNKDLWIAIPSVAYGNLIGYASTTQVGGGSLGFSLDNEGGLYYTGIQVWAIPSATNFGGASLEVAFVGHKRGYACKYLDPYVYADGWNPGDDGIDRWTLMCPYGIGLVNAKLLAEVVNPAS